VVRAGCWLARQGAWSRLWAGFAGQGRRQGGAGDDRQLEPARPGSRRGAHGQDAVSVPQPEGGVQDLVQDILGLACGGRLFRR
jgi:hypothetical protein